MSLQKALDIVIKNAASERYDSYVSHVHEGRFVRTKAALYLCRKVQSFLEEDTGAPYDILVLSMPPQHGKSMTVTETLPSWYLGRHPDKRVILLCYNDELAARFGRRNRQKLERFGQGLFGVTLSGASHASGEFELEGRGGSMVSCGVGSGVTGRAADLLIIDDPIKNRQEADSETYRRRLWDEWQNSFKTRLAAGAKVILIQTRWHEDDLAGRILRTEKSARCINLPCMAEENDPLGRLPGQSLCPELGKDDAWLADFAASYQAEGGARAWNALFQGRPTSQEGALLKRSWFRFYETAPPMDTCLISVDAAFKNSDASDFVSMQVWGKHGADFYLLDCDTRRLDFPQTLSALWQLTQKWPAARPVLVEDKANGTAILQVLSRSIPALIGITPKESKQSRVNAVSPAIEAGHVFLPKYAPDTSAFVEECAAFPRGAHDDRVDAMSQALHRLLFTAPALPAGSDPLTEFFRYGT